MAFYEKEEIITPKQDIAPWLYWVLRVTLMGIAITAGWRLTTTFSPGARWLYMIALAISIGTVIYKLETVAAIIATALPLVVFTIGSTLEIAQLYGGFVAIAFVMGAAVAAGWMVMVIDSHSFKCAHCGAPLRDTDRYEGSFTEYHCKNCNKDTVMEWTPKGPVGTKLQRLL